LNGAAFGDGQVARAFTFDGTDDLVEIPDSDQWTLGLQDFTIDLWINFSQVVSRSPFIARDDGGGWQYKWIFWYDESGHTTPAGPALRFHLNSYSADPYGAIDTIYYPWSPTTGRWYHVAVTRSGSTYALFVDGVQVATSTNQTDAIQNATAPLTIGGAEGNLFNGFIDEVDIFNRALSADEIHAIFASGNGGKCAPTSPSDSDAVCWECLPSRGGWRAILQ
jgi:hypothetical protein